MSERLASRVWDRADKDCSDYTDAAVNMLEEANATIEQQAKDIEELVEALEKIHVKTMSYVPCLDAIEDDGGENSDEILAAVFHIAYYAIDTTGVIAKHKEKQHG